MFDMDFDLYRNDGSILFASRTKLQSTDKETTTDVASGFDYARSFKQVNSTHVAVSESNKGRITIVNREDNSSRVWVGMCDRHWMAFYNDRSFYPDSIEMDKINPGHLVFTELLHHSLRSVDLTSGTVSTVIRTGFNFPRGLTWYKKRLLVCNDYYISEVSWSTSGAVTNKKLTTSTAHGYRDGDFSIAQFGSSHKIKQIRDGLFLLAGTDNSKLRLLNMSAKKVLPVCIGSSASCTTGTTLSPSA